ncbi:MAG: CheR family methyltransferase [Deltaproteobacteria bacterium]
MADVECARWLQAVAPRLGLRWRGFRNNRGQVCKRIRRRIRQLGLPDLTAYQEELAAQPAEWQVLERLCTVTLSRFYRDTDMWQLLRQRALPAAARTALAAGETTFHAWSAGCASGEEPYTLSMLWAFELAEQHPSLGLAVLGTDLGSLVLARARAASYAPASLSELPSGWRERAFEPVAGLFHLREALRSRVELRQADLRRDWPEPGFRLIFCRNLAFTYFDERHQAALLEGLLTRLSPGGLLVVGKGERLPLASGAACPEGSVAGQRRLADLGHGIYQG